MRHDRRTWRWVRAAAILAAGLALYGCATLRALRAFVQPLHIEAACDRPAELRLAGGRLGLPDAATLRLWARVENPNTFGLTLSAIDGAVSDLPSLGGVIGRAVGGNPLAYRLEGRITLGQPTFGPSTLLRGEVQAFR
jgi:hypothetical protein